MTSDVFFDELNDSRFRLLLETAPDAMVIVNERGRIDFVNVQTEVLFGYSRSELLSQPVEILIPERFRGTHEAHRMGFVSSPKVRPMGSGLALSGRHKDGSDIAIEVSLNPLHTPQGVVVSVAIRDIRERRRMEAESKLTSERLLSAVESIQEAFAIFDAQGQLVLHNSAFRRIFANGRDPEIGETYEVLLELLMKQGVFDLGTESLEAFRARRLAYWHEPRGTFDVRTKDGRHWRIIDQRTPEGGTVKTVWDLTDDVKRHEELQAARAAAEAASLAKSEFLSSMSHELRTPLNAILGFSQLLQRDRKTPLNARQLVMVDHVLTAGDHLLRLINDVLDLSRIETGIVPISTEPVSVDRVLLEAKTALEPMAQHTGVKLLIAQVPNDLPWVAADRTRFVQILMNFGSNAIKYSRQGGRAVFEAKEIGAYVRVTVSDNGIGIPHDQHAKVFQPFQRAGQEAGRIEGTGIGLTITKRLAEMMGGSVGFQSVPGRGSDFWVDLPIRERTVDTSATLTDVGTAEISPLQDAKGPRYTVLYVEDNPSNIAFMTALISDLERVTLLTAPNAEIGVELARTRMPDVILMDINLPGMSGFGALRELRTWPETRAIPVIALSAAAMDRDKKRAMEAGFNRYLTKPVSVDELTEVLEELLTSNSAAKD